MDKDENIFFKENINTKAQSKQSNRNSLHNRSKQTISPLSETVILKSWVNNSKK